MKIINLATLFLLICSSTAFAQKKRESTMSIEIDAFSNYVWRDIIGDFFVIQPTIDYSFPNSGFNLNFWLSTNSGDFGSEEFDAADIATTLYYNWTLDNEMELNMGIVHYSGYDDKLSFLTLPIRNWTELYTSFGAYDLPLSPSLELYYNDIYGAYATLALEHSFDLNKLTLNTAMLTGYRELSQDDYSGNGWREVGLSAGVPFDIGSFSFELGLTHVRFPANQDHLTYIGLNISFP